MICIASYSAVRIKSRVYLGIPFTRVTVNLARLVNPPFEGTKNFDFENPLDRWKKHFREKNYIEITSTGKSTKTRYLATYFSKILEKYLDRFFWAPIPQKRFQNTSGFASELHLVLLNSNYSLLQFSIMNLLSCGCAALTIYHFCWLL